MSVDVLSAWNIFHGVGSITRSMDYDFPLKHDKFLFPAECLKDRLQLRSQDLAICAVAMQAKELHCGRQESEF